MWSKSAVLVLLTVAPCLSSCRRTHTHEMRSQALLQRCESANDVAIRFFYSPHSELAPGPLILLPASSQDPRLNTRPAWILYVSLEDLHRVVHVLDESHLEWKESAFPKQLVVDPLQLPHLDSQTMEISVSYPQGSGVAEIKTGRWCPLLSNVYGALDAAKARENMSIWTGVDCVTKPSQKSVSPN
jgi:hypothetical protein